MHNLEWALTVNTECCIRITSCFSNCRCPHQLAHDGQSCSRRPSDQVTCPLEEEPKVPMWASLFTVSAFESLPPSPLCVCTPSVTVTLDFSWCFCQSSLDLSHLKQAPGCLSQFSAHFRLCCYSWMRKDIPSYSSADGRELVSLLLAEPCVLVLFTVS